MFRAFIDANTCQDELPKKAELTSHRVRTWNRLFGDFLNLLERDSHDFPPTPIFCSNAAEAQIKEEILPGTCLPGTCNPARLIASVCNLSHATFRKTDLFQLQLICICCIFVKNHRSLASLPSLPHTTVRYESLHSTPSFCSADHAADGLQRMSGSR